jgi:hypothetical protein
MFDMCTVLVKRAERQAEVRARKAAIILNSSSPRGASRDGEHRT